MFSGLGYLIPGKPIFIVRTLLALNPVSTLRSRITVRINKPAQTKSTNVRATSAMTSVLRSRLRVEDPPALRPSFNQRARLGFESGRAGARPNKIPVITDAMTVNNNVGVSIEMLLNAGLIRDAA